ncbi:MAG: hypothetical protein ACYSTT_04830 [Planctomycetota bacterium]|jgi:hypothetical protein
MSKKLIYSLTFILVLSMTGSVWSGASNPNPVDGSIVEATWINMTWTGGQNAASFDVYFGDNFEDVKNGTGETFRGNQDKTLNFFVAGFAGYPYPDGLVPGTTYYWRIDEIQTDGTVQQGSTWSFKIPSKKATNPNPADGSEFVDTDVILTWEPGFDARLHTVYFGEDFDEVNNASAGIGQGVPSYSPGTLELEKVYYWRIDEFDGDATYKGDIWSFTTPGAAGNPQPANAALDVKQTQILSWTPADNAASHDVYLGTDKDAVQNATKDSPEYQGNKTLGDETLNPGTFAWDTAYYWRVDAVYTDNTVKGLVWGFTTANFLVIDDFEDYDIGNNEIWWAWKDGLGYAAHDNEPAYSGNGTGSAVGDETTASYTEETIVHGGSQSMPLWYDNNKEGYLNYSEAELTLGGMYPGDWTVNDVNTLTVYFRGSSSNAAEQMYVALNGSAVANHDDLNAAQISIWTAWNIDLQTFAGQNVDLANVNTIAIGLGDKNNPQAGGSGKLYIDDIRLAAAAAPVGPILLLDEDFEGVELGASIEESPGTENVWTDTPPEGWIVDESGVPGIGDPDTDGVADWAGWAFVDRDWWFNVDLQGRDNFQKGQGTIVVADPDEWDDTTHADSAAAGWYKTYFSTPTIDISEAQAGTVQLTFDSSWRPEFDSDYRQSGIITASFDGGEEIEILLWLSDPSSPNFKSESLAHENETVVVDLDNPPWAKSVVLKFGMFDAGNDWWWAIDNIKVTGMPK